MLMAGYASGNTKGFIMQTIELPSLADQFMALPAGGAARNRQIHRLIDLHSSTEAADALAQQLPARKKGPSRACSTPPVMS